MDRFVAAAKAMRDDGWWWNNPALTNKAIKRTVLKEMIMHRMFSPAQASQALAEPARPR